MRYYGKLGETVKEEKTVEAHTPAVQKKTFTTEYVFDSFGRMTQMTYPDGEKLFYAYDNGGLLKAAWGEKSGNRYNYITSLIYDEFGQRLAIAYGNGVTTNYTYDSTTRRLTKLKTTIPNGRVVQNLSYHYDLVGNVMNLGNDILTPTNTALPAGPVSQTFRYDDLYQLTHGEGMYSFGPGKQNSYTNDFIYDSIGNMTNKTQVHKIIQPSMSEHLPKETNYVLSYVYGSSHPHAVTDAGDKLYSYDANGNMAGWTHKTNGTRRVITWNEENRVKQIDDNGKTTYFLYDDAGERVVKRGQHGETIYANRFYAIRNGELGTKHIFAGEARVLSKLVKTPPTNTANSSGSTTTTTTVPGSQGLDNGRGKKLGIIKRLPDGYQTSVNQPVEKDFFYYHGDHLGSSNMISDVSGEIYQHLEYFPYGESWIEEGGSYGGNTPGYKFTGKELDPETGLYYYGARYYDPVLSTWISADPALPGYLPLAGKASEGIFKPGNLALFRYGSNNPVRYIDPDGRKDQPFNPKTDKPIDMDAAKKGATPLVIQDPKTGKPKYNENAYNCHSYAWENSEGDPKDPANAELVKAGIKKWDNDPANNIEEQGYKQLKSDDPNKSGDRVIYYIDKNKNSKYDKGEPIEHSAIVRTVDKEGNTTEVEGKMGQMGISKNHPNAPDYYDKNESGESTSRAYFRKEEKKIDSKK